MMGKSEISEPADLHGVMIKILTEMILLRQSIDFSKVTPEYMRGLDDGLEIVERNILREM